MSRKLLLAVVLGFGLQAGVAGAILNGAADVYRLEAYIDQAPAGVEVAAVLRIGTNGRSRHLLVVASIPGAAEDAGEIFQEESASGLSVTLAGTKEALTPLLDARKGAKVSGTFLYRPANRTLIVQQLDS